MRRTKRSKNTGSESFDVGRHLEHTLHEANHAETEKYFSQLMSEIAPETSRMDVTVTWRIEEESLMNLFAVVLVGADHVIERLWKVAKSPEDVLIELGRDGVQPEQIVTVDFCVSLSPENVAMYES